jgi:polar amino acid transport system substrate-binding protein
LPPDSARSATPAEAPAGHAEAPLRIVTMPTAPFVLPKTDPPVGFSVDLWNEVARRMHVESTWRVLSNADELFSALQHRDADVAIGAIAMTPERERIIDFSFPYFDSGLRIAVRANHKAGIGAAFRAIPWVTIGHLFAAAIVIIFLLTNLLWLIERRRGGKSAKGYLSAVGDGLWRTMLVISTLNADRDAPVIKRLVTVLSWLFGVILIAELPATVTSTQTVARLESAIRGPDDLPGKTIASVPGTAAGDYLTERGLPFKTVTYGPDAIRMLTRDEVQAVVFDAATLQYWAARQGKGLIQVVGPLFRPLKYGIAVPEGSPLRKQINRTLLEIYTDGTYEKIYSAWFVTQ